MFLNHRKTREPDGMSELVRSSYSTLNTIGYLIPENMLAEIEREAEQITRDSISHNLIDEFTVDEMQSNNLEEMHFIDRIIHHKFVKPLNELKRQKIVIEWEIISSIQMLQKAELMKQRKLLDFARAELEQCYFILEAGNNSKAHI